MNQRKPVSLSYGFRSGDEYRRGGGMVCQGMTTTVGVSLEAMYYHTGCVSQGLARSQGAALVIADFLLASISSRVNKRLRPQ